MPGYQLGFTSLESEVNDLPLRVQGRVPDWLRGTLLRTGPAKFEIAGELVCNSFDGLAMLYAYRFGDAELHFSNRYLRSHAFENALWEEQHLTNAHLLERASRWFIARRRQSDNGCINVARFADSYLALAETCKACSFDPRSLHTTGVFRYRSADVPVEGRIATAHPHYDTHRETWYNCITDVGRPSRYRLISIDNRNGEQREIATIAVRRPAYMHSFGMTQRYIVITEFPFTADLLALRFGSGPFIDHFRWRRGEGIRFHVIDKDTGNVVRQAEAPPAFALHHVNAFESAGKLHVDMVAFRDATVLRELNLGRLRSSTPSRLCGRLTRWRIDLATSEDATVRPLSDVLIEFPRMNYPRCVGHSYRYLYALGNASDGDFVDNLTRIDLALQSSWQWRSDGCYPGEPVFVPLPGGKREDDGVVLSVVLDANRKHSFLLVLDAATWQERARVDLPTHIPFGFHGQYYSELH